MRHHCVLYSLRKIYKDASRIISSIHILFVFIRDQVFNRCTLGILEKRDSVRENQSQRVYVDILHDMTHGQSCVYDRVYEYTRQDAIQKTY